jgi:hypothetical protein
MDPGQRNRHTGVVYNWVPKPTSSLLIQNKINDICLSLKAGDYLQLPTLSNIYHQIEIDTNVRKQYDELRKDMVLSTDTGSITATTAATLAGKLLQFTSGAIYAEDGTTQEIHSAKLEFLTEILEGTSTPTLIFYHFKHSLQRLRIQFPEAVVLDNDNIEAWQSGKIRLLLAHPQSFGVGVNLQCNIGDTAQIVWWDLPWSSENYTQGNARVHRQGQKVPVIIHHLAIKNTIDERVINVLEGKINIQEAVLKSLKFALI